MDAVPGSRMPVLVSRISPRRVAYMAAPALAWVAYIFLFVPYLGLRAKGDELRGWTNLERVDELLFMGDAPSRWLQEHLYAHDLVALDFVAFVAHFSWFYLPIVAGALITFLERRRMFEYLAWLLAAFYVSTVFFLLFPVEPPWMQPGIARILTERSFVSYTGVDNNQVAAFPSLHAAIPMLMFLFFTLRCDRLRPLRWVWLAAAAYISLSVVYLGEHWVVDVMAGWATAAVIAVAFTASRVQGGLNRLPGRPVDRVQWLNEFVSTREPPPVAPQIEPEELPRAA